MVSDLLNFYILGIDFSKEKDEYFIANSEHFIYLYKIITENASL